MSTELTSDANFDPSGESTSEEQVVADERDAYAPHLTVADGFRFGCGLILVFVAFLFLLVIGAAAAVLTALLLGVPLPFGAR